MARRLTLSRGQRNLGRGVVALLAAAGFTVATSGTANAAPVQLNYPLSGTTHLAGTDSDLELGPGTLETTVDLSNGALSADTNLPPATGSFKTLDLIPATATTEFIETEPTAGTIDIATGEVNTVSKLTLRITELKVAGIPIWVGSRCKTEVPAEIALTSEPGFNPFTGGTLSGEYTIPDFEHCLLATPVINAIIPGEGNTISLDLGTAEAPSAN
ncbi:hypothetical protein [Streptomyces synnematoformans]|uniref:Secreted protein n=1 Tax=Streptomyces synnematoformans TaxID=415721 RepID=A0ABN2YC50_9ACTN